MGLLPDFCKDVLPMLQVGDLVRVCTAAGKCWHFHFSLPATQQLG
jgi:hypothetical protein